MNTRETPAKAPLAPEPAENRAGAQSVMPVVLLVDDDENVLHGLSRSMFNQPFRMHTAKSGQEAIWTLKTHEVDVIVSDERMPGMCGSDLLAWVAEHYPDTVRIVLTGYASTAVAIRAINAGGVFHFFTKPCDDLQLAMAIRRGIEQRALKKENIRLNTLQEQQLRDLDKFSEEVKLLGRVIARDIQKPLGVVANSCTAMFQRYPDLFDPKAQVLVDRAMEGVVEAQDRARRLLEKVEK